MYRQIRTDRFVSRGLSRGIPCPWIGTSLSPSSSRAAVSVSQDFCLPLSLSLSLSVPGERQGRVKRLRGDERHGQSRWGPRTTSTTTTSWRLAIKKAKVAFKSCASFPLSWIKRYRKLYCFFYKFGLVYGGDQDWQPWQQHLPPSSSRPWLPTSFLLLLEATQPLFWPCQSFGLKQQIRYFLFISERIFMS